MSDYRYGDVISMQEAAIRRVNEMQRRAREAARLANEELAGGKANIQRSDKKSTFQPTEYSSRPAGHTNLPVDYLHGGGYPSGYSVGYSAQNSEKSFGNSHSDSKEKEAETFHNSSSNGGNNHTEPQRAQNTQQKNSNGKNAQAEKNNKPSAGGNKKANNNSWAQTAVNRQQKQTVQNPPHRDGGMAQRQMPPHNVQRNNQNNFSFGDKGIFSALGGVIGNMDNDTILLLGLLYILWRDGADYGLLFALFYILM